MIEYIKRRIYYWLGFRDLISEPKIDPNFGSYGGFNIWYPEGHCKSGHFWGDKTKITDCIIFENLMGLLYRLKKEENWSDDFYQQQLKSNIKNNGLEDYYTNYCINQSRFEKLENMLK